MATLSTVLATVGHAIPPKEPLNWYGWTPSVAVGLGMMIQSVEGSSRGLEIGGGPIRPPATGQDHSATPHFEVGLALSSPRLEWIPGGPSVFASVEILPALSLSRNVAAEGSGDPLRPPPNSRSFQEEGVSGQGSRTTIETRSFAYAFHGGLSFPVELGAFAIRVNPGVSWLRYVYDVDGRIARAIKPNDTDPFFRAVVLEAKGKLYVNAVGPTLSIEVDAGELGPFLAGVYIQGAAYRVLGDRSMRISDNVTFSDQLGTDTYQGRWSIEVDDWAYRFGVGLRIYLADFDRNR